MSAETVQNIEHNLGPVEQIPPGEGREFLVAGERVAIFRLRSGAVRATQADCPHKQGPLVDGLVGGETVICPFHSWKFDLMTGLPVVGDCSLAIYGVRLSAGGDLLLTAGTHEQHAANVPCAS
jgi:nitrite reductase (NADH) small subunit